MSLLLYLLSYRCIYQRTTSTPVGTRTQDLLIRSELLYPAELRVHNRLDGSGSDPLYPLQRPNLTSKDLLCTRSGNRTRTPMFRQQILSLSCLPIPPSEHFIYRSKITKSPKCLSNTCNKCS